MEQCLSFPLPLSQITTNLLVQNKRKLLSRVQLFVTPWTTQPMEFSRPEYWSGQPFPSQGDLPKPGIEPTSPALQADSLPAELHASVFMYSSVGQKSPMGLTGLKTGVSKAGSSYRL